MASARETSDVKQNPAKARDIAKLLLALKRIELSDWELDFLEVIAQRDRELSTRQGEKLLEIRDDTYRYTSASGYDFKNLGEKCWRARDELDENDDVDFLERWHNAGMPPLRRSEALRLRSLAIQLGELEEYVFWSFATGGY